MKIEINSLAQHFACTSFRIEEIYRCVHEPGRSWFDRTQRFPGFIFPLGGAAEFVFEGTPYLLSPGNVVHGGAGMELARRVLGGACWEYILVLYSVCGQEPPGMCLTSTHFELQTGQSPRLAELLRRLWQISSQPGGIPAFQRKMIFGEVLEEMFVSARNQSSDGAQALFQQVSSYIHEHYNEALAVPRLAEQSGINRNRLAYLFRKYAGMGPGNYLLQYRLNRAKELLLSESVPVREVAQAVGFADPLYFSRVFRKRFGISPSVYREKVINNPC